MEDQNMPGDPDLKKWCILQAVEVQKAEPNTDVLMLAEALYKWLQQ